MILGFWGLTVFPEKTYTQIVDNSFKLSMAALDEEAKPGRSSVRVTVDQKTFILCSLIEGQVEQQNLDLVFTEGEEITFSVSGENAIHLSGNYLPEDEGADYSDEEDIYGDDASGVEIDEQGNIIVTKGTKRAADFVGDEDEDEDSEEDPDFTGEDSDDDEEDSDEDGEDNEQAEVDEDEEDSIEEEEDVEEEDMEEEDVEDDEDLEEEDVEEDEDEDEDEDEEEDEAPVTKKQSVTTSTAPPAKKQKVTEEKAISVKAKEEPKKKEESKKTLPNGLIIEDIKVGQDARAKGGKKVGMRYIGRLTNGKVFDKNVSGKPFTFNLERGEVIKGWDIGIKGMKLGGERRLTIPPALAYGSQGAPPDIPPNATLVFEVKVVSLK